ncbi:hypothetical protein M514_11812 [Trichuris suis]|uniref:Uncharacterized protein n=1 Tax=Trichuris suis TaxID=68888 RepID=A0A085LQQ6_9BILA|nr:hypothetical protein M513_11812 [Trichuris suis]KFD60290.1 hypothetical protein M514_11812 [Trichuris suis]
MERALQASAVAEHASNCDMTLYNRRFYAMKTIYVYDELRKPCISDTTRHTTVIKEQELVTSGLT